jgi:alcohol-forming fatty acyl-CoA reductase
LTKSPSIKVVNTIIAAAWKTALNPQTDLKVYRICSSGLNKINSIIFIEKLLPKYLREYPMTKKPIWYPTTTIYTNRFLFKIHNFIAHRLFPQSIDFFSKFSGKEKNLTQEFDEVQKSLRIFHYFLVSPFKFPSENVPKLLSSMSLQDRQEFPIDVRAINWDEYIKTYVKGIRKFLMKQDDSTLEESRRNIAKYVDVIFKICRFY